MKSEVDRFLQSPMATIGGSKLGPRNDRSSLKFNELEDDAIILRPAEYEHSPLSSPPQGSFPAKARLWLFIGAVVFLCLLGAFWWPWDGAYTANYGSIGAADSLKSENGGREASPSSWAHPAAGEASSRHWIFDDLGVAETRAVAAFVVAARPNTRSSMAGAGPLEDFISGASAVELLQPNKAQALAYVEGRQLAPPERFARVTIVRSSHDPPDVMEYKVGPIHGCDVGECDKPRIDAASAGITPLLPDGHVSFEKRPYDMGDQTFMPLVNATALVPLQQLLVESFGAVWDIPGCPACHNSSLGTATASAFNDISSTKEHRITKMCWFWYGSGGEFQASWLHPIPFSHKVDQTGPDPAKWFSYDFMYCGQGPYASAAALLADPALKRCDQKADLARDGEPGDWDIPGPGEGSGRRSTAGAPKMEQPGGVRYQLSSSRGNNGRFVAWQGWSFFATLRPSTGLAAMDLRFQGRRVAYELALSEATAVYSGTDGDQVFYLDSAYSMSQLSGNVLRGVDCPEYATYLNATLWVYQDPATGATVSDPAASRPYEAICIFEEDSARPLWRHTQYLNRKADGVRASTLVVRAVATVSNYDYITEYRFGLDGSVKVAFTMAGYCETRWYQAAVNPFERTRLSEVVHANVAAPLHTHFGSFKVDLDVLNETNSFELTRTLVGRPPSVPDTGRWPTKYLERQIIPKEGIANSTFVVDTRHPTVWRVINPNAGPVKPDAETGGAPGYAIIPGATLIQAYPDDHPFTLATAFSKYSLAVTQRKESEQRVTSVYDLYGPGDPVTSIDRFLEDGDSLEERDVVAWVTVGKEHLPRREDVPLISDLGVHFQIVPWNLFDGNVGMDIRQEL